MRLRDSFKIGMCCGAFIVGYNLVIGTSNAILKTIAKKLEESKAESETEEVSNEA